MVVPTEYFFYYAQKDVLTKNNDGMKNSKENGNLSAKKSRSGEVVMNLFLF